MSRARALIIASHPGPSLAITAMAAVLAAEAPRGSGRCSVRAVRIAAFTALLATRAMAPANVLPDLAADRATGVNGLPEQVAARWGPGAVRAAIGARGTGRVPSWAAIGIAAVDVVLFAVGVDALT